MQVLLINGGLSMLLSYAQNHQISENTLPCIRRAVLHDVLLGRVCLDQVLPSVKTGPFQVLLLRAYFPDQKLDAARLTEQFFNCIAVSRAFLYLT